MSQPRLPYGQEEEPPAYNYGGYRDSYEDNDLRYAGSTMRLLPASSHVDSDLSTDLGTYRQGDPFGDENQ